MRRVSANMAVSARDCHILVSASPESCQDNFFLAGSGDPQVARSNQPEKNEREPAVRRLVDGATQEKRTRSGRLWRSAEIEEPCLRVKRSMVEPAVCSSQHHMRVKHVFTGEVEHCLHKRDSERREDLGDYDLARQQPPVTLRSLRCDVMAGIHRARLLRLFLRSIMGGSGRFDYACTSIFKAQHLFVSYSIYARFL